MDASLSIDARPKYFCDAVRESVAWIEKTAGCVPCKAPAAAFDPLYSSWYSFHRDVHAVDLEAELAVAAKLGMKTFIVDDGWQYEEGAPVGYPYCGDWRLAKGRFPDMASSGTE